MVFEWNPALREGQEEIRSSSIVSSFVFFVVVWLGETDHPPHHHEPVRPSSWSCFLHFPSFLCLIDLYWEKGLVYGVIGVDKFCLDFFLLFFLLLASPI